MWTVEMPTKIGTAKTYHWTYWTNQKLQSSRQCPLALDTETDLITDDRIIPRLALAVASDGRTHVTIHPDRLGDFLLHHQDAHFVGHNVAFDFWVVHQHLTARDETPARRALWETCHQGRLFDTQILDLLLQLATGQFRHAGKSRDAEIKVYPGNLADVAADYTSLRLSKDDPYRLRFGELLELPFAVWAAVEPGFFQYAVRDAIVTRQLYPALAQAAYQRMVACGFARQAQRYDIHPDALEKFGHLSETLQVKASIVLAHLLRRGVRVDLTKAQALGDRYRAELTGMVAELERSYREVLTYRKDGKLKVTPKSQTPSLGTKKLGPFLSAIAVELQRQGHDVVVPTSKGKKNNMSLAIKDWSRYAGLHPFLQLWTRSKKLEKLLGFVASLTAPVLHCEYTLLKRTGRTSCSKPRSPQLPGLNIQQMPKLPEFRALFIPVPDCKLFIGDFASAELRTLAAVCRAKFGESQLGDVITQGIDPHAFTAAAIQGLSLADFQKLKDTDLPRYKEGRQRSKPINFGVPGGMGAKSLQEYARSNYGVDLTPEEAQQFRHKLITEVYPELSSERGYLADDGMATLAHNLGVTEREAWEVFDRSGQRNPWTARGVTKVIAGTSTASGFFQAKVWDGLARLLNTVAAPHAEVADLIGREQGGRRLHELLCTRTAATLTGRLRTGCAYTDAKNTPFQSLCADGGKLGLWNLLYAGFDVYAFIHDEVLVQLPAAHAEESARQVEAVMVQSMEAVMGHGIPAACDWLVADHWTKP